MDKIMQCARKSVGLHQNCIRETTVNHGRYAYSGRNGYPDTRFSTSRPTNGKIKQKW